MSQIPDDAIKCLDKGFVRLVDSMGGDDAIVQAARVSYGKGTSKLFKIVGLSGIFFANRLKPLFKWLDSKSIARRRTLVPRNGFLNPSQNFI